MNRVIKKHVICLFFDAQDYDRYLYFSPILFSTARILRFVNLGKLLINSKTKCRKYILHKELVSGAWCAPHDPYLVPIRIKRYNVRLLTQLISCPSLGGR